MTDLELYRTVEVICEIIAGDCDICPCQSLNGPDFCCVTEYLPCHDSLALYLKKRLKQFE